MAEAPVVTTEYGRVGGRCEGRTFVYRGIPYADLPVGVHRWAPPRPPPSWSDVHDGRRFGAVASQWRFSTWLVHRALGRSPLGFTGSEDCLTLNVWTPADRQDARRPVLVWIHGGGYVTGSTSQYEMGPLSEAGEVVIVSMNYRLGSLGFFAHPELSRENREQPANFGYLDIRFALEWVKRNISAFGGDPDNVTVFGESAGGHAVLVLLVDPRAEGLFHRAICQSGPAVVSLPTLAKAEEEGIAAAARLGWREGDALPLLRATRARALSEVHSPPSRLVVDFYRGPPSKFPALPFCIDGSVVPCHPLLLLDRGNINRVPVLLGSTADEGRFFHCPVLSHPVRSVEELEMALLRRYGAFGLEVLRRYPSQSFSSPNEALVRITTEGVFHASDELVARALHRAGVAVYRYVSAVQPASSMPLLHTLREGPGAYHASDLAFLFSPKRVLSLGHRQELTLGTGVPGAHQRETVQLFQKAWCQFARAGTPNGAGLPPWPVFTERERAHLRIEPEGPRVDSTADHTAFGERLQFWADHYTRIGLVLKRSDDEGRS